MKEDEPSLPPLDERPASMSRFNVAHKLEKRKLLVAINCLAGLSIFFFGYDQGMMGGVNNAADYIARMKFGHTEIKDGQPTPVVTDSLLQGGIVSVYYLGTLVGCLAGGIVGEKIGRIHTIAIGAIVGIVGATLQCSAMNAPWMICARLVNGWGTGILNAIVPVYATETADHTSRGQFIAIEFTLNIVGVVVAYWLEYGLSFVDGGYSPIRWRFPVAFQILFLLILLGMVWFFPESPRWLTKVGREGEARYILGRLRGTKGEDALAAEAEFEEIREVARQQVTHAIPTSYLAMLTGRGTGNLHLGRRVQLVIWLQIMQEWVGIAGVTIYAPTIFRLAGFDADKSQWISGLNNIFYMFSTLICVFTLDRIGRRWTLYWGAMVQGIAMFLCGAFTRLGLDADSSGDSGGAGRYGIAAASMVFLFTFTFGATWLTVPWLYPAEIFPLAVRAKGNAFGVVGWSIGNGWLTYYLFGIANMLSIPIVWALYPESNQRTLEEMDLLFAAPVPWTWTAEANFKKLKAEHPEIAHDIHHEEDDDDDEPTAAGRKRKSSKKSGSSKRAKRAAPGGGAIAIPPSADYHGADFADGAPCITPAQELGIPGVLDPTRSPWPKLPPAVWMQHHLLSALYQEACQTKLLLIDLCRISVRDYDNNDLAGSLPNVYTPPTNPYHEDITRFQVLSAGLRLRRAAAARKYSAREGPAESDRPVQPPRSTNAEGFLEPPLDNYTSRLFGNAYADPPTARTASAAPLAPAATPAGPSAIPLHPPLGQARPPPAGPSITPHPPPPSQAPPGPYAGPSPQPYHGPGPHQYQGQGPQPYHQQYHGPHPGSHYYPQPYAPGPWGYPPHNYYGVPSPAGASAWPSRTQTSTPAGTHITMPPK